jgi:hypothetical protein
MSAKKAIFLSHATPEDNEFTRWLGAKLTLSGYDVWYDLERLKGGDITWDKIESAIREETIRFIAIISKESHGKDGVKKEWTLASNLEKKNPGFVIPIRIDEFSFDDVTILFSGKNILDFHRDWFRGLTQVLETLEDAKMPRASEPDGAQASLWWKAGLPAPIELTVREERIESSWIPIVSLPSGVEATRKIHPTSPMSLTDKNRSIPWFEHENHVVGFAPRDLLIAHLKDEVSLEPDSAYSTEDLLTGNVIFERKVTRDEAYNRILFLIRQAWDLAMEQAKLRRVELAGRQTVWFVPKGLVPDDRFSFFDDKRKQHKKQLVGRSEKYKVNWHYGVSARPVLGKLRRMEMKAHILFTENSGALVDSETRMHSLRRGFCRNWWNPRWRDFQRALLAYLSQGYNFIRLAVGGDRYIELGASPFIFTSPIGLTDTSAQVNEEEIIVDQEVEDLGEMEEEELEEGEIPPEVEP